jgi:hypothetical protein
MSSAIPWETFLRADLSWVLLSQGNSFCGQAFHEFCSPMGNFFAGRPFMSSTVLWETFLRAGLSWVLLSYEKLFCAQAFHELCYPIGNFFCGQAFYEFCCPMGNFSTVWVTVRPLSSVDIVTVYSAS